LGPTAKNKAPKRREHIRGGDFCSFHRIFLYIAHFSSKSKPYRAAKQQFRHNKSVIFAESVNGRGQPPFLPF
jgi:hypothetical protein